MKLVLCCSGEANLSGKSETNNNTLGKIKLMLLILLTGIIFSFSVFLLAMYPLHFRAFVSYLNKLETCTRHFSLLQFCTFYIQVDLNKLELHN